MMNRMVENYIRYYCRLNQDKWDRLLSSTEFPYNSAKVESLKMNPFELDLVWNPGSPLDLFLKSTEKSVQSVNELKDKLKCSFEDAMF